jgi:hypothetical protein
MRSLALILWGGLMAAAVTLPYATGAAEPEEAVTRYTVRAALLYYAAAVMLMLCLQAADWPAATPRGRLARFLWTLAWLAYVVHQVAAFGGYHHGSHAAAVEHTRQRSGFGAGIYFSHLFTLLWTADVAWWWLRPRAYAERSPWLDGVLHGYMLFIIFNATVVFEEGLIRWAGVALCAGLATVWCARRRVAPT